VKPSTGSDIPRDADVTQVAWDAVAPVWRDVPLTRRDALAAFLDKLTKGRRERASRHSDSASSKIRSISAVVLTTAGGITFVILTFLAARDLIDWFVGLLEDTGSFLGN
jgi:hypothetical protein